MFAYRNTEFYGDEHLRSTSDANIAHRPNVPAGDYDSPAVSQPSEVLKQETPEALLENQYSFPSSAPGYNYENAQQFNTTFAHQQASSQMQNLAPFSSVMVIYQTKSCLVKLVAIRYLRDWLSKIWSAHNRELILNLSNTICK